MNFLFIKESWKKCHGLHTTVFNIDNMVVCVTQNPKWIQICLAHMMLLIEAGWSSSRSCCTHDCAVKSSARLQFHSWRVKHFFDSNWSGFQSTSERCVYSHCQALNPLCSSPPVCFNPVVCAHLYSPWPSLSGVMAPRGSAVTFSFYLLTALKLPLCRAC